MFRLDGKVALVSGAGRGMGLGVAEALARQGATVVINDFYADRADAGAQKLQSEGLSAHAAAADMTDRSAIFGMVEGLLAAHGKIDIFVHNAGIPAQGWGYTQFLESPQSEWDAWLQLNLYGLMHACQAVLPSMQEGQWGRIVAINFSEGQAVTKGDELVQLKAPTEVAEGEDPPCPACGTAAPLKDGACSDCGLQLE